MASVLPDVVGSAALTAKQSAVDAEGEYAGAADRRGPCSGQTRPVPHEDGHVTEVARAELGDTGSPRRWCRCTSRRRLPGRVRAWGAAPGEHHPLLLVSGAGELVSFDGERSWPRSARSTKSTVSLKNLAAPADPPNPLRRLEEHRRHRGYDRQHARPDVRLRTLGRARSALGQRCRRSDRSLSLVGLRATRMSPTATPTRRCDASPGSRTLQGIRKRSFSSSLDGPRNPDRDQHERPSRPVRSRASPVGRSFERQRRESLGA